MLRFLNQNIFCLLVLWLSIGIVISRYTDAGLMSAGIVSVCGCAGLLLSGRRSNRWITTNRYAYVAYALIFISIGMAVTTLRQPSATTAELSDHAWIYGVVKEVRAVPGGTRMEVTLTGMGGLHRRQVSIRNVNAYLTADSANVTPGDKIVWRNKLTRITTDGNRQADAWPGILSLQGILYRQHLTPSDYRVVGKDNSPGTIMAQARSHQCRLLAHSRLSEPAAALTQAILTGDRQALATSTLEEFRLTGLSHILALSGLHIGILTSILLFLLLPLNLLRGHNCHKIRWIIAAILLWGYAVFTGLGASVVRACVMATVLLFAMATERPYRAGNALGLAGFAILLFDPLQLFQAGFQLSFLITALILAAIQLPQREQYRGKHRAVTVCRTLLMMIVAMIGSWLLTAFYFHSLSLGSLPWNLLAALILPVYFIASVAYSFMLNVGCDPAWAAAIVDMLADGVLWCGNHPQAGISVWLNGSAALCGAVALGCLMIWLHLHTRKWLMTCIGSLVIAAGCVLWLPSGKPKDGFIVQNYAVHTSDIHPLAAIRVYASGRDTLLLLHADTTLLITIHNRRVLLLDNPRLPIDTVRCNLLLIGPKYRGVQLPGHILPDTVLLLPSLHPGAASRWLDTRENDIPVLNLRDNPPYPSFTAIP